MSDYRDYVVYVLWSAKHQKKYTGMTSNLVARFKSHNELGQKGWTKHYRPWEVVFVRFFKKKGKALKFEKYLKTGKGREWMTQNINFE